MIGIMLRRVSAEETEKDRIRNALEIFNHVAIVEAVDKIQGDEAAPIPYLDLIVDSILFMEASSDRGSPHFIEAAGSLEDYL
jgi:hypothetical protein